MSDLRDTASSGRVERLVEQLERLQAATSAPIDDAQILRLCLRRLYTRGEIAQARRIVEERSANEAGGKA